MIWYDYFCWLPMKIEGRWIWLKTVQRMECWNGLFGSESARFWFEYRMKKNVQD